MISKNYLIWWLCAAEMLLMAELHLLQSKMGQSAVPTPGGFSLRYDNESEVRRIDIGGSDQNIRSLSTFYDTMGY